MKNISNIPINKNRLDNYLSDFNISKKNEILELFKDFDFNCGATSFIVKMRSLIAMPKIGKTTNLYWISRGWTEEQADDKRVKLVKDPTTSPMNINFWIKRGFNEDDARIKIKSQRNFNKEYWMNKGYSEEDSISKSIDIQKENNKKYIDKFKSDEEFRNKINSKRSNNINYWLNKGYSTDESKKLVSERQNTFSLEKCVNKHGVDEGQIVWKNRQEKWNKSLLGNGNLKIGYSNISQILFDDILESVKHKDFIFYGKKNKEIALSNSKSAYLYDFTDLFNKRIIEFNGDIFHGNPNIFNENDKPNPFKDLTCLDLWEKDRIKTELAISNGFEVLTIWELEYKNNKEETLNKCLNFLNKNKIENDN